MTHDRSISGDHASASVALDSLPKSALQAIYHAVTGKTENLSKEITGNKVITDSDIDRLHGMLLDQFHIHNSVTEPTITIIVKLENQRSVTYSSWERFKALNVNNYELTSELTLRMECVIQVPNTRHPQRYIINVNLDSSLPFIKTRREEVGSEDRLGLFLLFSQHWKAVSVSIDFVDYIVAKGFMGSIEEWYKTLTNTPSSKFNDAMLKRYDLIRTALNQSGRIGMAAFLLTYAFLEDLTVDPIKKLTVAVSIGFFLWALYLILEATVSIKLLKRLSNNIIPSVIIATESDRSLYNETIKTLTSPANTMLGFMGMMALSLSLNILASYIYTYISNS